MKTKVKKRILTAVIALGVAAAVSAGGVYASDAVARNDSIGENAAKNFAFIDAGVDSKDAVISRIEFELENGVYVYDIEFTAGGVKYEYDVKASDGTIVSREQKKVKGSDGSSPASQGSGKQDAGQAAEGSGSSGSSGTSGSSAASGKAYLSVDAAKSRALAAAGLSAGQVSFSEAKLERDDGRMIFDIEFVTAAGMEYEFEIDAYTGAVLEWSAEPADDDGRTPAQQGGNAGSGSQITNGSSGNSGNSGGGSTVTPSTPAKPTVQDDDDDDDDRYDYDDDYDDDDDDD